MVMTALKFIFNEYIVYPLYANTGYNIVNTLFYAVLFIISCLLLYKFLFETGFLPLSEKFVLSLSGWCVFGGILRVAKDYGITHSILFVSPFIYIIVFCFVLFAILVDKYIITPFANKNERWQFLLYSGWTATFLVLNSLRIVDWKMLFFSLSLWLIIGIVLLMVSRKIKFFENKWNFFAIQAQMLDACGSFVGITYCHFWEKHVLARNVMRLVSLLKLPTIHNSFAYVLLPLKFLLISLALYLIDNSGLNENETKFVKMVIILLGIGIGTRNVFSTAIFCRG